MNLHPHQNQPIHTAGARPGEARAAVILIHGRGDSGRNMLLFAQELAQPGVRYYAPTAAGNTWYPNRFTAPLESNEPYLSSALELVASTLLVAEADGVTPEKTILLGFSQGACLALESAFRHPRRLGALAALSGGMITPPAPGLTWPGSMQATPVLLGCSDRDPHTPEERVRASADFFRQGGADVTLRIYPGLGHTICQDEVEWINETLKRLTQPDPR